MPLYGTTSLEAQNTDSVASSRRINMGIVSENLEWGRLSLYKQKPEYKSWLRIALKHVVVFVLNLTNSVCNGTIGTAYCFHRTSYSCVKLIILGNLTV